MKTRDKRHTSWQIEDGLVTLGPRRLTMGVQTIKIEKELDQGQATVAPKHLAKANFQKYQIQTPPMNIWMMSLEPDAPAYPWWDFAPIDDQDISALNQMWGVRNSQNLFDCLYLRQFQKFAGKNLYVIFSGNIKKNGWSKINEGDQATFLRGQECMYQLEGSFQNKLAVNWVPFHGPQSLVAAPSFGSLWRMFSANHVDGQNNCITFFSLSNPKMLPLVVDELIKNDPQRSVSMAGLVDWFGVYSSPGDKSQGASSVVYTKSSEVLTQLEKFQENIKTLFTESQQTLLKQLTPKTAIQLLSRHIAL